MPAPFNPYRRDHNEAMMAADTIGPARSHEFPLLDESQAVGFHSIDVDSIAHRNYRLGRQHGYRDRHPEVDALKRDLRALPAKAYDQGYDTGERECVEQVAVLLEPVLLVADVVRSGKRNGKRLSPKQREQAVDELLDELRGMERVLRHAVQEDVAMELRAGTITRLREALG